MRRFRFGVRLVAGVAAAIALNAEAATPSADPSAATPPPAKPPVKVTDLFGDPVIAKGKNVEVKRSQLDEEVIRFKSQLAARGQNVPPEHNQALEQNVLEQLIQLQLVKAKATDADKVAGKAIAEKKFEEAKERLGSEESVNMRLKAEGLSREQLIEKWADAATADAVLKHELNVDITDAEVKKYYDENPARFEQPEMVRASHILLGTKDLTDDKKAAKRKLAEELVKRARAGEDFAKLVKENSEDPGSRDKGGEYTFPRGQMVPEFEIAAFGLKPNEVSDVVATQFGYHVIKLSEKIPAKKMDFDKVKEELRSYLALQAITKQMPDYVKKLKKEAGVEYLDEKYKPKEVTLSSGLPEGHPAVSATLPANHPPVDAKPDAANKK